MPSKTVTDFDPRVLKLFDPFVHCIISRRGFFQSASQHTAGSTRTLRTFHDAWQSNDLSLGT